MFIVAAVTLVSCGNVTPVEEITNLYKDATSKVWEADNLVELADIAQQLDYDISKYYYENKVECDKIIPEWNAYHKGKKKSKVVPQNIEQYDALMAAEAEYKRALKAKGAELALSDIEFTTEVEASEHFDKKLNHYVSDYNDDKEALRALVNEVAAVVTEQVETISE